MSYLKMCVLLFAIISLNGCARFNTNTKGNEINIDDVEGIPMEVDVKVGDKISGTCSYKSLFGFALEHPEKLAYGVELEHDVTPNASECVQGAVYQAISSSNADVIIAPRYFSDEVNLFCLPFFNACIWRSQEMKVVGYKGTYGNFKALDQDIRKYRAISKSRNKTVGDKTIVETFINKATNLFSK